MSAQGLTADETGAAVEVLAVHDSAMMHGVGSLPHGWGHDQPATRLQMASERPGANLNALTHADRRDPLRGNAALNGQSVKVRPADG